MPHPLAAIEPQRKMHKARTTAPTVSSLTTAQGTVYGAGLSGALLLLAGCPGGDKDDSGQPAGGWQVVASDLPSGLMSVQGTDASNVWIAGAGGTAFHYDGTTVGAVNTQTTDDLWWVQPTTPGAVFVGANGGMREHSAMMGETSLIPGPSVGTFFGVWGPDDGDLWAVGGDTYGAEDPMIWRGTAGTWAPAESIPAGIDAPELYYKVHGAAADDVWVVGTAGIIQHYDGASWTDYDCGGDGVVFTVHTGGAFPVAVGGAGQALVCNYDAGSDTWVNVSPPFLPTINGVSGRGDTLIGVGQQGTVIRWSGTEWVADEARPTEVVLHGVWVDDEGGIWAVGGNLNSTPITGGVILYDGPRTIPPL